MIKNYIILIILLLVYIQPSPAQDLDATLLELNLSAHGNPQQYTKTHNGFYFVAQFGYYQPSELWFSQGTPETTFRIMEFTPFSSETKVNGLKMIGNTLFFVVRDNELWTSQGTTQSTKHIMTFDNFSENTVRNIIAYNGKAYFQAVKSNGPELWVSDGTTAGTKIIKDINPGVPGSNPSSFFVFQDKLFFLANDGVRGRELWYTDGTPVGTTIFKDINPTGGAFDRENNFIIFNNEFYFTPNDGIHGYEIWKSDGTVAGTALLIDTNPSTDNQPNILQGIVVGNSLIFTIYENFTALNLWKTDGTTEGTIRIKNITPTNFVAIGEIVYFLVFSENPSSTEIWKTDGTGPGTSRMTNFLASGYHVRDQTLTSINNRLYFSAGTSEKFNMWSSDGSSEGTFRIGGTKISHESYYYNLNTYFEYNGRIYFTAEDFEHGREVYVSNGTRGSISLFKEINRVSKTSPSNYTDVNGQLFFTGELGPRNSPTLFKSLGTPATSSKVGNIKILNADSPKMYAFNDKIAFLAYDPQHGLEFWLSNGTEHGTYMVKDIFPGDESSFEYSQWHQFYPINNHIYFKANDGVHGNELWKSDGTEAGTYMVKDIIPGNEPSGPGQIVSLNGSIFFSAWHNGMALFKTDGTAGGTQKVRNINDIREIRVVNGKLLLVAETSGTTYGPHDLWVSDGTEAGTKHLESFGDGIDSHIQHMAVLGTEIFFVAKNKENATQSIYKSDGTVEGTKLVFDGGIHPDFRNLGIDDIFTCGQYVYFGIKTGNFSFSSPMTEIWRTDGTPGNTKKIASSNSGNNSIHEVTCYKEDIYFLDSFEHYASTIFSVKKTANTAVEHKLNILNGEQITGISTNFIETLGAAGDHLYFSARTKYTGTELYSTKPGSSSPGSLDDDNDGVLNTTDICPGTPSGLTVDAQGCEIPEIPSNNYKIEVTGETCFGLKNGKMTLTAQRNYNYTLIFNGNRYNFTNTISLTDLIPGDYEMCVIIMDYPNYNQCYTFNVDGAPEVLGSSRTVQYGAKAYEEIEMRGGTPPFTVAVNGKEVARFGSSSFQIEVGNGDALLITSKNACEGKLEKNVLLKSKVKAYPNPTLEKVFINIPGVDLDPTRIRLYNASQQLIFDNIYEPKEGGFEISLANLPGGVYFVQLDLQNQVNLKVIKL